MKHCKDCGKEIKNFYALRCKSCAMKERLKQNPEQRIDYQYPEGYWKNKKRPDTSERNKRIFTGKPSWNKNKHLSKTHRQNLSKSHKGKKFTKEHKQNISKARKKLWKQKKYREHMIKERTSRWKNIKYKNKWAKAMGKCLHRSPNKIEKCLAKILSNYQFVGDGKFILDGLNPDFVNYKDKKIIELYGDYWHNLPGYKKRDKRRINSYKKYGYKTLIIWEHELKNKEKLKEKINGFNKQK